MDAEAMTFPDATFDVIVVHGVLHHLDLDRAYAELARVLKPGGHVICTEALRHNPIIQRYRRRTPHLRTAWEVDHILGKPEIERARRYFDDVRVARFFHLATIAAVPLRGTAVFPGVLRLLEAADAVLLRIPGLKWQAWMAVFVLSRPKARKP
jgi:SAM-dependent methyltransferase